VEVGIASPMQALLYSAGLSLERITIVSIVVIMEYGKVGRNRQALIKVRSGGA